MEKKDIIKRLITKAILPMVLFAVLGMIAISILKEDNSANGFIWAWMICGLPFGITRMRSLWVLRNGDLGTTLAVFVLNFVIAGLIGGFIAAYKVITAFYYLIKGVFELVQYKKLSSQNTIIIEESEV